MEVKFLDNSERKQNIHDKGFDMTSQYIQIPSGIEQNSYKRIKVGVKQLDDAILELGNLKTNLPLHRYLNKQNILKAIATNNIEELRDISDFFYNISGIYQKFCNHFAFLYRYDWYVVPEIYSDKVKEDKILKEFSNILNYLDNSYIKRLCGEIALEVIKKGAYYGYTIPSETGIILQQLPVNFCRSRYSVQGNPAIEFNMKFFDTFTDPAYRLKILKLFPEEFSKGYLLYKSGKLAPDFIGDNSGSWYLLNPENTVKFNFNNSDIPWFINTVPYILDLDAAQDLDRRKQMQKLLKIIVQKLPLDKNGDLIFDIDEAQDIHNNAVQMLKRAIGVDVLTTFADIESIDMSDNNTTTSRDDLEKVERTVFNSAGVTQNLFNTDGNLSVEKSILNDESQIRDLLLQFNMFFNRIIQKLNKNTKKYNFKLYMLETTQYNYKELSKLYKEQTQLGYSKMLPQIALGHSQSFILNTAHFENKILHLTEIMIPPLMSSTMSSEDILGKSQESSNSNSQDSTENNSGRPTLPDDEKSEKTIQNLESSN